MYHYHKCKGCGMIWGHDPDTVGFDYDKAHDCPRCARPNQRDKYVPTVQEKEAVVARCAQPKSVKDRFLGLVARATGRNP